MVFLGSEVIVCKTEGLIFNQPDLDASLPFR
jgi:hypothetical protein